MLLFACIVMGFISIVFFCFVVCGHKSLRLAIQVVEVSSNFISKTKRILLVPIIFFCLTVAACVYWFEGLFLVLSMNKITVSETIPQMKHIEWASDNDFYLLIYMFISIFWVCAFLNYTCKFIIMVSAASFYFDSKPQ